MQTLRGRNLLSLYDFSLQELRSIIDRARQMKIMSGNDYNSQLLRGKSLGMIFDRPSTRTRVAFASAMTQLGGQAQYLSMNELQTARGEPWRDTAIVLGRYLDGILIRSSPEHEKALATHSGVPVISGSSGFAHPTQALADLLTIMERKQRFAGLNYSICWGYCSMSQYHKQRTLLYDTLFAGARLGMNLTVAYPRGYCPFDENELQTAREEALHSGGSIRIGVGLKEGIENADVILTKSWWPLGVTNSEKVPHIARGMKYPRWKITSDSLDSAKRDVIVMHPLPAVPTGEQLTDDVKYGPRSAIFDEAENRLHVAKAILSLLL